MFRSVSRVMTQMAQRLMRMTFYTSSQIIPELLWLVLQESHPNRVQENSLSPARPGTLDSLLQSAQISQDITFNLCKILSICLCVNEINLQFILTVVDKGKSCMRRSYVSRSRSWSSSMKSVRGSLKFKAKSKTCSGPVPTSRYYTKTITVDVKMGNLSVKNTVRCGTKPSKGFNIQQPLYTCTSFVLTNCIDCLDFELKEVLTLVSYSHLCLAVGASRACWGKFQ